MTAELLRQAAAKMRERATLAAESIDEVLDDLLGDDATGLDGTWDEMVRPISAFEGAPGEHIASWSPAVALTVADWLDAMAGNLESLRYSGEGVKGSPAACAFAVARAYLGNPVTVHGCPEGDSGITPCCGRTPFDLLGDRLALDPAFVTCKGGA